MPASPSRPRLLDACAAGAPSSRWKARSSPTGCPGHATWRPRAGSRATVREDGAVPATIAVIDGAAARSVWTMTRSRSSADGHEVAKLSPRRPRRLHRQRRHRRDHRRRDDDRRHMSPGSTSSPPAGSAACIAAPRRASTSRPTCRNWRGPRSRVVAAGAKAILDLPKTLEVLETLGVPVIAFGQDELPAFWSRASGLPAPLRLDSAAEIAAAHLMRAPVWASRAVSWSPIRSPPPPRYLRPSSGPSSKRLMQRPRPGASGQRTSRRSCCPASSS